MRSASTFRTCERIARAGRYDAASRNLMVDGLLKRFLEEIDAVEV